MEDFPGLGKTLAARSFAQALGLDFTRAQFTPDLLPADLTGSFVYDQRPRRVRVPRGAGVHRPPARRRDQPHAAEDPGRAARGDAGAPGHRRGPDLPAAAALPRARHRQPGRVRGHLPAARGAARPLPPAGRPSATPTPTGSGRCSAAGCAPAGGAGGAPGHDAAELLEHAGGDGGRHRRRRASAGTASRWPAATRDHQHVADGRLAARVAGADARGAARTPCIARPRLRHPGGRQGRRPARAGAPDHGAAGAVDERGLGAQHRRRPAAHRRRPPRPWCARREVAPGGPPGRWGGPRAVGRRRCSSPGPSAAAATSRSSAPRSSPSSSGRSSPDRRATGRDQPAE